MGERRATGALEAEVLDVLWASPGPLTAREVSEALVDSLAYTTVMTVLSRLWDKGLLDRVQQGRAYAYSPSCTEAEIRARELGEVLRRSKDRRAVLSRFVDELSDREARSLRALLDGMDEQ